VHDDVADLFANLGPARLAGRDDIAMGLLEMGGQARDLRRLAGAFRAFEGDEFAGGFLIQWHARRVGGSAPVGEERFERGQ
jgi:hypothetical protein